MNPVKKAYYHVSGVDPLMHQEHTHPNTYELIQCLSGEGEFIIHSGSYRFGPGTVLLINAEEFHYSIPKDAANYTRNKLILCKQTLNDIAGAIGARKEVLQLFEGPGSHSVDLKDKDSHKLDGYIKLIHDEENAFQSAAALMNAVGLIWTNIHTPSVRNDVLSQILKAINESIDADLSLDDISSKVGISRYYLCHYFKSRTGMTVLDYLRFQRMDLAKKMLSEGRFAVSDVAAACGFSSQNYFSKCFKDTTGMSPREYMKQQK